MGLRFRKSYNLGCGFRINLSKHGVGYSWGVPGYRISNQHLVKPEKPILFLEPVLAMSNRERIKIPL